MRNFSTGILEHEEGLLGDWYATFFFVSRSWRISNDWSCVGRTFNWERGNYRSHLPVYSYEYQFQESSAETKQMKSGAVKFEEGVPAGLSSTAGIDGEKSQNFEHAKVLLPKGRSIFALTPDLAAPPFLFRRDSQFYTRPTTVSRSCPFPSFLFGHETQNSCRGVREDNKIVDASASVFTRCW